MGAGLGVILAATLSREELYAWGWRIPFLLGVLIAPVAFYIRRQLPETIDAIQPHRSTGAGAERTRAPPLPCRRLPRHPDHLRSQVATYASTLHDDLRDHHARFLSATIATALGVRQRRAISPASAIGGLAGLPWAASAC